MNEPESIVRVAAKGDGVTASGRPTELPDVERMVGLFINTLPLRVTVVPEQSTVDWLREVHARANALIEHQDTPLTEVQRWSGLPPITRTWRLPSPAWSPSPADT